VAADQDVAASWAVSEWSKGPPYLEPPEGGGCLTAFLILIGIALLLPGLCAVWMIGGNPWNYHPTLLACIMYLAIAACGIALIWLAVRRRSR
jgi:hypothetical protein